MTSHVVHVQQLDSVPLAVVKRQASQSQLSRLVPECCGLVWNALRAQNAKGGRHIAIYWDDAIHVDIGAELQGPFVEHGDVVRSATPAGTVATTTHFGPYGGLGAAHDAIHQWCRANSRRLAGPSWEIYGHWLPQWDADPLQIRTDVYYLLSEPS
jgi:effector-binding domain-containing protein